MLQSLIFRWVARSSDSLVAFIVRLDATLDQFLAKHDADVAGFEQDILNIGDEVEAEIERIKAEAEERINDVRSTIEEKTKAANILLGLKNSLPTGE